ncbi:unnamed protein product [Rhizophagus irregularis]|nr:unnamed protein product [Rhizophagus irregularis]
MWQNLSENNKIERRKRYELNRKPVNERCHQRRRRRIINRIYYNTDTLNRFTQIPLQITNDPFAIQLFNGSSFY